MNIPIVTEAKEFKTFKEPKVEKKLAKIKSYWTEQFGSEGWRWDIWLSINIKHDFTSINLYSRKSDALKAAKDICKQLNIEYVIVEEN